MKNPEILEKLNVIVERQLGKCIEQLEQESGKLPMQDADYLDKLSHIIKSNETTLAMQGYGESERRGRSRYTGRFISRDGSYDGSYEGSYEGSSRRGSYEGSRRGSYRSMAGEDVKGQIRELMEETDDERVRRALQTAMQQI